MVDAMMHELEIIIVTGWTWLVRNAKNWAFLLELSMVLINISSKFCLNFDLQYNSKLQFRCMFELLL